MAETFYKVVNNIGGSLRSAAATGSLQVTYEPEVFTKADLGYLFVFRNRQAAEDFSGAGATRGSLEVWSCEIRGEVVSQVVCSLSDVVNYGTSSLSRNRVNDFWAKRMYEMGSRAAMSGYALIEVYPQALLAEQVKLLQKVS